MTNCPICGTNVNKIIEKRGVINEGLFVVPCCKDLMKLIDGKVVKFND